jgi:hypothetical protein
MKILFFVLILLISCGKDEIQRDELEVRVEYKLNENIKILKKKGGGYKMRLSLVKDDIQLASLDIIDCKDIKCNDLNLDIINSPKSFYRDSDSLLTKRIDSKNNFTRKGNTFQISLPINSEPDSNVELRGIILSSMSKNPKKIFDYFASAYKTSDLKKSLFYCMLNRKDGGFQPIIRADANDCIFKL